MSTLVGNLVAAGSNFGGRPALILDDHVMTYAEFLDAAGRVAAFLRTRGLRTGDRVGVMLPNTPAFPIVFYGTLMAGGIAVPMNPLNKAREVKHYLKDSEARFVVTGEHQAAELSKVAAAVGTECVAADPLAVKLMADTAIPPVERTADDVGVIIYTAGMTGVSRGAQLTNANLASNAATTARELMALTPADVVMACLPFFHVFGLTATLNAAVRSGSSLVLIPRFTSPKVLDAIQRHRVTAFLGVPTMLAGLLAHEEREAFDVSSLRVTVSGGSSLPVEILTEFEKVFGCPVYEGYGLSETAPVASFNHPALGRKPGSIGTPIPGGEMRVFDEQGADVVQGEIGEIVIRGENVMKGYWRSDEATAQVIRDGWLHTGDLARVDEDGYFFITGRKKDLVIRGGLNVYPGEVEEVLLEHPAVAEAIVFPIPDPVLGEEVAAAVVLRPGRTATPDELRIFARSHVAPYKYPRQIRVVEAIPGDVPRSELGARLNDL